MNNRVDIKNFCMKLIYFFAYFSENFTDSLDNLLIYNLILFTSLRTSVSYKHKLMLRKNYFTEEEYLKFHPVM